MQQKAERASVRCSNDCRQTGCPGHHVKVTFHHTSDTVTVEQDSRSHVFDKSVWRSMVELDAEIRNRS